MAGYLSHFLIANHSRSLPMLLPVGRSEDDFETEPLGELLTELVSSSSSPRDDLDRLFPLAVTLEEIQHSSLEGPVVLKVSATRYDQFQGCSLLSECS